MIELIILLWIYILLGIIALIKAVAFGINLSKDN